MLATLVLAIPVIVAANPVDPTWILGLYDDADSDQLITQPHGAIPRHGWPSSLAGPRWAPSPESGCNADRNAHQLRVSAAITFFTILSSRLQAAQLKKRTGL
jgi:hypothetical protein